jgi:hypothetical protein
VVVFHGRSGVREWAVGSVRTRRRATRTVFAAAMSVLLALVSACSDGQHPRSRPTETLDFVGAAKTIPADFLGANGEGINTDLLSQAWHDPRFAAEVASLHLGNIRVFGGTSANLWNWSQGRIVHGPPGLGYTPGHPHPPLRINRIAAVVRASGATPMFDLNLVTSTLSDQLAMLTAAHAAGLPVIRVELGNELWSPVYAKLFPSGSSYAFVANKWIAALHDAFPGVQVAVDVDTVDQAVDARGRAWNSQVLGAVSGADAVSVHQYVHTSATAPAGVISAVDDAWTTSLQPTLAGMPPGMPVWLTEWNYAPPDSASSQVSSPIGAEAIGVALFGVLASTDSRIRLADFHALDGWIESPFPAIFVIPDDGPDAALRYRLSPSGAVLQLLMDGLRGCTAVRPVGGIPGVTGFACVHPGPRRIVLVNVTGSSHLVNLRQVHAASAVRVDTLVADPLGMSKATPSRTSDLARLDRVAVPGWSVVLATA